MIELVTLDYNGTMVADTQVCIDIGNHLIETFGGKPLPRKEYIRKFDFPSLEFYCRQGADREAMLAGGYAEAFQEFYEPRASKCRTRRGMRKLLNWLSNNSVDSIILSNHIRHNIIKQLKRLGIEGFFAEVLANESAASAASGKNKVQRLHDYLAESRYNPSQAAIIGDSPEDIGIGKELGMMTIGITDGYFHISRLRASRPDHIVSNLVQVIGIIKDS